MNILIVFQMSTKIKEKSEKCMFMVRVNTTYSNNNIKSSQHIGLGKQLLKEAEILAKHFNCDGLMVIAGVGTRNYYRKFGYDIHYEEKNHGGFMVKYF
jgi:histone acetyltransferase (RNA polymerase elongator complex component)